MQWLLNTLIVVALSLIAVILIVSLIILVHYVTKRIINDRIKKKLKELDCHLISIEDTEIPQFLREDEPRFGPYIKGNPLITIYKRVHFEDIHQTKYEGIVAIKKVYGIIRSIDYYFPVI